MTAAALIERANRDGLTLAVTGAGTLRVSGDPVAVDRWAPVIRDNKPEVLALLAANDPQIHRRWQVTDPSGKCWSVTRCPPVAHGEMARSWPPGSTLAPVPDQPRPTDSPPLPAAVEAKIQAWLASIGEVDTAIIGEVLDLCADDPAILAMYLGLAGDMPGANPRTPTSCGTCAHYRRTSHPRLGTCRAGEPEPAGGLRDTTPRSCDQWEAKP